MAHLQNLQSLQARSAFGPNARRNADTNTIEQPNLSPETLPSEQVQPKPLSNGAQRLLAQLPVQDIQHTAANVGFAGVSEQDILRAYQTGESLLADYSA